MKTTKVKAYAKINLTLQIVGNEGEYHLLDSLVASVDLYDLVVLKKRKDKLSSVTMKGQGSESIPPESNNALKAAELFSKRFDCNGADIAVYKNIPLGAGLGGSSADASGVLLGMAKLYGINDETALGELADALGSDTKYMLEGGFARMRGRGEKLERRDISPKLHFLAICPKTSVSAGACYREYDARPIRGGEENATEKCLASLQDNDMDGVGRYLTNDLFPPAARLNADVRTAYDEAKSFSPLGAVMTGSGSCVLAMFESRELCEWAKSRYRGKFRTMVLRTVAPAQKDRGLKNPFAISEEEYENAEE